MALIKELQLENGSIGNYWKIIKTEIDFLRKKASITFGLLKDKDLNDEKYGREGVDNSKLLLETKIVDFDKNNFPFTKQALEGENVKAIAYSASKQLDNFFKDATDDL